MSRQCLTRAGSENSTALFRSAITKITKDDRLTFMRGRSFLRFYTRQARSRDRHLL